ncbi:hypothetical protein LTR34_011120 [Exophiala xenobiotica]|uniref:Uncharacterized protein n=1 Tax=Vermiconidia calcicola TaxID=1690605 RepID=A0AAV9PSE9_9PEZI|nr:hypothetical protein LTR34_011120 [Exophiala xenobiotica]KAK5527415.1 hypothetical protein LTR25_011215 [Vermiconidia calcicola]
MNSVEACGADDWFAIVNIRIHLPKDTQAGGGVEGLRTARYHCESQRTALRWSHRPSTEENPVDLVLENSGEIALWMRPSGSVRKGQMTAIGIFNVLAFPGSCGIVASCHKCATSEQRACDQNPVLVAADVNIGDRANFLGMLTIYVVLASGLRHDCCVKRREVRETTTPGHFDSSDRTWQGKYHDKGGTTSTLLLYFTKVGPTDAAPDCDSMLDGGSFKYGHTPRSNNEATD